MFRELNEAEFKTALCKKLKEETIEFLEDYSNDELADIFEIVLEFVKLNGITQNDLENLALKKRNKNGGFTKKLFLEAVIDNSPIDNFGHLDNDIRIANYRHAGIVIKDNKILLMHRIYKGEEYWVIPGGHMQKGEEPKEVVIREVLEETSVTITKPELVIEFQDIKNNKHDFYYICEYVSGEPLLGGEESEKNSKENFYEPMWVDLNDLDKKIIYPEYAKYWILENIVNVKT